MPIKTVLFDMGNVLVYFSHDRMCQNVAAVAETDEATVREILMGSGLQWQLERGEISEEEFHAGFEKHVGKTVNSARLKQAAADIFWLNDSIVPLVDQLAALGIRLVLLSNTSVTHLKFIEQNFDILNRFDDMTTSCAVGALKPESAIYEDALRRAQCDPADCFYTDDIEDYVLKAREFGVHAEVYTQTDATREALRKLGVAV